MVREDRANMVLNHEHAADVAEEHGHAVLATQMHELWAHVEEHHGYARYDEYLKSQRVRWVILRERRFTKRIARYNFARATIPAAERTVLDWLFVGTADVCPYDVFSVIMGYWAE